jgi:predicted acetyltransferase
MIKLVLPSAKHEKQIEHFKVGILSVPGLIHGTNSLENTPIKEWVQRCEDYRNERNLPDGYVPSTQFIAIREEDSKIVGMVNLRHRLVERLLHHGGHIGYMTAIDERRKGYCKEMLRLCLIECKKMGIDRVMLTCKKSNIGSSRTMIANGGVLDSEYEMDGEKCQRYWIKL